MLPLLAESASPPCPALPGLTQDTETPGASVGTGPDLMHTAGTARCGGPGKEDALHWMLSLGCSPSALAVYSSVCHRADKAKWGQSILQALIRNSLIICLIFTHTKIMFILSRTQFLFQTFKTCVVFYGDCLVKVCVALSEALSKQTDDKAFPPLRCDQTPPVTHFCCETEMQGNMSLSVVTQL